MFQLKTLLIHSYFYLPSNYQFKNVSINNKRIIYNENTIIYHLNNVPENDNKYDLYQIFLDSVFNNSYDNQDYPEPFSSDLANCNNYRLMVNIDNKVLQNIINNNHQIPSENIFLKLLESNNYFFNPLYDPIDLKVSNYNVDNSLNLGNLENNFKEINYCSNSIFKDHNLTFHSLVNRYSCKLGNRSNYLRINGGVISKMINYQQLLKNSPKETLIISDNEKHWKHIFTHSNCYYTFTNRFNFRKSKGKGCYFVRYFDLSHFNYQSIMDIYWERILIDINMKKFKKTLILLKKIKSRYKWFLVGDTNTCITNKIIFEYLLDFKNIKYPFLELVSKGIINTFNWGSYSQKNIVLEFSKYEQERYREHSKRENDINKIYLQKLCCYPDVFFNFNKLFPKCNTTEQYLKIVDSFYDKNNAKKKFIQSQLRFFNSGSYLCPICFEKIPQSNFGITICGHIFCFNCITKSMSYKLSCPECRTQICNNIFKIDICNSNLKLLDFNPNSLVNILGTKITFITYLLSLHKIDKIIVCSKFFSFLKKISLSLNHFKIKSILLDNKENLCLQSISNINIFLSHSKTLTKKKYNFLNIKKIFLGEPMSSNNLMNITSNLSDKCIPVYQLIINNTVESDFCKSCN